MSQKMSQNLLKIAYVCVQLLKWKALEIMQFSQKNQG